jgi:hypothetical protein
VGTSAVSDKPEIATAAISGGKIRITSVGTGAATVTVSDGTNNTTIAVSVAATGAITLTVSKYSPTFTPATNESIANTEAVLGLVGTSAVSDKPEIATTAISGGKIKITSVGTGAATVTVSDDANHKAAIAVSVAATGAITLSVSPYTPTFTSATDESIANTEAVLGLVGTKAVSDTPAVATAALSDDKGKIKITSAVSAGTAIVTVSDGANHDAAIAVTIAASGAITATVKDKYVSTNPLIGAWRKGTTDNFTELFIFANDSIVYYAWQLNKMGNSINRINTTLTLTTAAGSKPYGYELKSGQLVIKDSYFTDNAGKPVDVVFTRIEGSSKTGVDGVWYSYERRDDDLHTLLIIREDGTVYTSFGMADNVIGAAGKQWSRAGYTYTLEPTKIIHLEDGSNMNINYSFDIDDPNILKLNLQGNLTESYTKTSALFP